MDTTALTNIYYLKSLVHEHLLRRFRTGDPLRDVIIACVVISAQDVFSDLLGTLRNWLIKSPQATYRFLCWAARVYYAKQRPQIQKEAKVKYITDQREINTLFEPVMWYINTLTDTKREAEVALETTKNQPQVMQKIPNERSAQINFLDHDIKYDISTEMVTIYADREHKRENVIITLRTKTDKNREADIFQQFSEMCQKKYAEFNKKKAWVQKIHRNERGAWKAQNSKTFRQLNTVILKKGQMEDLSEDLEEFIHKEEWYLSRDVPYTRRYLFWGLPGTGKSSTIRAIASYTKRDIHYLILSEVESDAELFKLLEQVNFQETVLVIEDIDCASNVVHDRNLQPEEKEDRIHAERGVCQDGISSEARNSKKESTLTLSGLLNAIDGGIVENHGQIMIITTNHPEKLDRALVRPGRVDRKFEFGLCDRQQIEGLFYNFFETKPPRNLPAIFPLGKISPAEITSVFLQHKKDGSEAWEQLCKKFAGEVSLSQKLGCEISDFKVHQT